MLDAKHVTTEDLKSINTQTNNTDPHSVAAVFQRLEEVNATYKEKIHNTYNTWEKHLKAGLPTKELQSGNQASFPKSQARHKPGVLSRSLQEPTQPIGS